MGQIIWNIINEQISRHRHHRSDNRAQPAWVQADSRNGSSGTQGPGTIIRYAALIALRRAYSP